jgi:hypothetical protein
MSRIIGKRSSEERVNVQLASLRIGAPDAITGLNENNNVIFKNTSKLNKKDDSSISSMSLSSDENKQSSKYNLKILKSNKTQP